MSAVLSVNDFCLEHSISRGLFYKLLRNGGGPTVMRVGRRTLISYEAAAEWRRRMERPGASVAVSAYLSTSDNGELGDA